jgi:hypothetical protein
MSEATSAPAIGVTVTPKPAPASVTSAPLRGTVTQQANECKSINVNLTNLSNVQVLFTGAWDGHLLKGVIRNIEKAYKQLKVNAMRENIAKQQAKDKLSNALKIKEGAKV